MQANELKKALTSLVPTLDHLDIPYCIGGSVASSVFGLPRSTMDIDIVADIKISHVRELVILLQEQYYIDGDIVLKAIDRNASFNIIHFDTMMKIDIFVLKKRQFDQVAFERKKTDYIVDDQDKTPFYFSSAEDIIINKLEWFRMGGEVSERQWKDIIGVLKVQEENLDRRYLNKWAQELGVLDLLEKAFKVLK